MYLLMEVDLSAGCKQSACEINLDVSEIYMYFRCNLNVCLHGPEQSS